jgi:hypothetical protein
MCYHDDDVKNNFLAFLNWIKLIQRILLGAMSETIFARAKRPKFARANC